jgi:hypothetical protein
MSTGWKLKQAGVMLVCAAWCVGTAGAADAAKQTRHKTTKKPAQLADLPSGPTGPVQPVPLDLMAAVPPQVSYQNDQLTIVAPNSTLGDILRAVRRQTGAEIEIPTATERVVTHLGPGPAREVVAELLNGSRFNYVLLGSAGNDGVLARVVLVAKTGLDNGNAPNGAAFAEQRPPGNVPPAGQQPEAAAQAQAADDTDDAADQAAAEAEAEQQQQQQAAQPPDQAQPGVKTPQELLQEMQQRQLQFQQQQNPGQPPAPGQGLPQRQPPLTPQTPPDQQ